MTPKAVEFFLGQIECSTTHKILSRYIKGLEQMLAENAKTINQHEELLALQHSEIEYFKDEVESLEYSLSNERFYDIRKSIRQPT